MIGKKLAAANPKAKATTCATKPGGLMPKYPAITTATVAAKRAANSSRFSVILGISDFLSKSWEMDVEITSNKPAAVLKAAASPPAATKPITQLGNCATSGLANTMMSLSMVSSFVAASATYCTLPSPFLSSTLIKPVLLQLSTQAGRLAISFSEVFLIMLYMPNAPIAGAVVYKMAINTRAYPADLRASFTLGTVKKRTITWGKPAVPTIKAAVMKNTSIIDLLPLV